MASFEYLVLLLVSLSFVSSVPVPPSRGRREMKESHIIVIHHYIGNALCPSGHPPIFGNICLDHTDSAEDESRLIDEHLLSHGHR